MKKFLYSFVYLFFISIILSGQPSTTVDLKKLDSYFAQMVKDWEVPSASIGIVKDGELVFTGNYGVLETGQPAQPNEKTLYAIASNSKAFTSAILGMLVQEGKLDWNDPVQKHLPYFELYDPWVSQAVTIRDLLSHRVGLGTFSGDAIWYRANLTAEEIIERIKHLPKAYDFRAGYGYSNLMYITAGEVIRKVTGKSWAENLQERIFKPLGMTRSITSLDQLEQMGNYATPHARFDNKNIPIDWVDWETVGATGGIISCVEDIAKWMIFNLDHGVHNGEELLSIETRNMVWMPHNNFSVDHTKANDYDRHFSAYGLGWGLSDYHGRLRVGHTGGYDGMITAVTLIPDENLGVVVLTNGMKSPIMAATYYAIDQFLGTGSKDWSTDMLNIRNNIIRNDTRISDRKRKRVMNTRPSLGFDQVTGTYHSDIYGDITVSEENNRLRIDFEHTPALSATLSHWHYDVWELQWDEKHAWFSFGTVKFVTDNNLNVTGLEFDVPNDDFFFEEFKPYRVGRE